VTKSRRKSCDARLRLNKIHCPKAAPIGFRPTVKVQPPASGFTYSARNPGTRRRAPFNRGLPSRARARARRELKYHFHLSGGEPPPTSSSKCNPPQPSYAVPSSRRSSVFLPLFLFPFPFSGESARSRPPRAGALWRFAIKRTAERQSTGEEGERRGCCFGRNLAEESTGCESAVD